MTRAPAAAATLAVASVLPLSTTMHSAISLHGMERTTWPIDSASFKAGITTEIFEDIRLSVARASRNASVRCPLWRSVVAPLETLAQNSLCSGEPFVKRGIDPIPTQQNMRHTRDEHRTI